MRPSLEPFGAAFFAPLRLCVMLLLAVAPVAAQQTTKELNEQLLLLLSQRQTPSVETVQQLLDKGAQVNQTVRYKTALMHAASEGHVEIVKLLLAKGAEVNAQTDEGTALTQAVRSGHPEIVKLLLDAGAQVDTKHRLGNSALIMSATRSIPEMNPPKGQPLPVPASEIMGLLLAKGADANLRGQWGHTALMEADTAAKVKLLVAHGAQVNAIDDERQTALIHAVDRGDVEVVAALLQAGADATVRDKEGATALMYALTEPESHRTGGTRTLANNRLAAARLLLKAKTGDLNAQNENGETLLMRAIGLGDVEIVKLLLERGADVDLADVLGNTAVVLAYREDQTAMLELMNAKSRRKPARAVLNAFLIAAIGKKDQAKVKELLAAGADANYQYSIGYDHKDIKSTPLILAARMEDAAIVELLIKAGADLNAEGLLYGSEHGLEYGTALQATKNATIISLLKKAQK